MMENIISKELLSKVLDVEICENHYIDHIDNMIEYQYTEYYMDNIGSDGLGDPTSRTSTEYINIYELMCKCKKSIYDMGYMLQVRVSNTLCCVDILDIKDIDNPFRKQIMKEGEPEAVFKAWKWIYNKENNEQ